eukprot:UC1_evm4s445
MNQERRNAQRSGSGRGRGRGRGGERGGGAAGRGRGRGGGGGGGRRGGGRSATTESSGGSKRQGGGNSLEQGPPVPEEFKLWLKQQLDAFHASDTLEHAFSSSLSTNERRYAHLMCQRAGLISKSRGKGEGRYLTVRKQDTAPAGSDGGGGGNAGSVNGGGAAGGHHAEIVHELRLSGSSRLAAEVLLEEFPVTPVDTAALAGARQAVSLRHHHHHHHHHHHRHSGGGGKRHKKSSSFWPGTRKSVTPRGGKDGSVVNADLVAFRKRLPVASYCGPILSTVAANQVVLISGETGCGKTTQVPQFIMDESAAAGKPCRIVCTQPRRISAITVAERVANEWGAGPVGGAVGYNIRLEKRVDRELTTLMFCTTGLLLRMMSDNETLEGITHVLMDEVHERDRHSDFLLVMLRDLLPKRPDLKLVLMSASLHADLFTTYFGTCPRLHVPGFTYPVTEFTLEQVLALTRGGDREAVASVARQGLRAPTPSRPGQQQQRGAGVVAKTEMAEEKESRTSVVEEEEEALQTGSAETWALLDYDAELEGAFLAADAAPVLSRALHLIQSEEVPVTRRHAGTGLTLLHVAAAKGLDSLVSTLLRLGADKTALARNGWTAADFATYWDHSAVTTLLTQWGLNAAEDRVLVTLSEEETALVRDYQATFDDDRVDLQLIVELLEAIVGPIERGRDSAATHGAILVFLPGYDEIMRLQQILASHHYFGRESNAWILPLHSMCSAREQRLVFQRAKSRQYKIILSTNIAEASVTIDDVVYVVNAGKVKEKAFDSLTGVATLNMGWASQASAQQRKGRAGRCRAGLCFHLFSQARRETLPAFQAPELLRTPLDELCLQAKMLRPDLDSVAHFLAKAPDPPLPRSIAHGLELLLQIDAINEREEVTALGRCLGRLSLEPAPGRMLLGALALGCLDPVLTLVSARSYRSPFVLSFGGGGGRGAGGGDASTQTPRTTFGGGAHSDHLVMLRAYAGWARARDERSKRTYSDRHGLNHSTMRTIDGTRRQLYGQLLSLGILEDHSSSSSSSAVSDATITSATSSKSGRAITLTQANRHAGSWPAIKAALCFGLYPNVGRSNPASDVSFLTRTERKARPQTSSCVRKSSEPRWIVFDEIQRTSGFVSMSSCTVVPPISVFLFSARLGHKVFKDDEEKQGDIKGKESIEQEEEGGGEEMEGVEEEEPMRTLLSDEWAGFKGTEETGALMGQIRTKWQAAFYGLVSNPRSAAAASAISLCDGLVYLLTASDQEASVRVDTPPAPKFVKQEPPYAPQRIPGRNGRGGGRGGGRGKGRNRGGRSR